MTTARTCSIWFAIALGVSAGAGRSAECDWRSDFVGKGLDGFGHALQVHDDGAGRSLYVAGSFTQAGTQPRSRIARWDGTAWHAVGTGLPDEIYALAVFDDGGGPALYAGGRFNEANGAPGNHVARWNGAQWTALGAGVGAPVHALVVHDDGSGAALYAGGTFVSAGGAPADRVARWNGTQWTAVGGGIACSPASAACGVRALREVVHNGRPQLFAGGFFTDAGGRAMHDPGAQYTNWGHIARWDGADWFTVDGGVDAPVRAIASHDEFPDTSSLRIGGQFSFGVRQGLFRVARYHALQWIPLRDGLNGVGVYDLDVIDAGDGPALYAAGHLTSAPSTAPAIPSTSINNITRWNGTAWQRMGTGLSGETYDIAGFDDGFGPALYATGAFFASGPHSSPRIAKWNCVDPRVFADGFEQ
jgi:hypothetical protein